MRTTLKVFEKFLTEDEMDDEMRVFKAPKGHILFVNDYPTASISYDPGDSGDVCFYIEDGSELSLNEAHDWQLFKLIPVIE